VGEGVVERVGRTLARDHEFESVTGARVLGSDGGVLARVPEQENADAVTLAGRKLADRDAHGISTSLTRETEVRSAT
jgi:hypothetical protein